MGKFRLRILRVISFETKIFQKIVTGQVLKAYIYKKCKFILAFLRFVVFGPLFVVFATMRGMGNLKHKSWQYSLYGYSKY